MKNLQPVHREAYLSRIETGEINPTVVQALRIADAVGITFGGVASRAQKEWMAQKKQGV